jgi:hypothetical protein
MACKQRKENQILMSILQLNLGWHWFRVMGMVLPFEIITYAI